MVLHDLYIKLFVFDKSGKNGTVNGNRIIPFLFDTEIDGFKYAPEYIPSFPVILFELIN